MSVVGEFPKIPTLTVIGYLRAYEQEVTGAGLFWARRGDSGNAVTSLTTHCVGGVLL